MRWRFMRSKSPRASSANGRTTARGRRPCAAARLDPPVDVLGVVLVAAAREPLLDGDVDAAERVDERGEAVHVEEHVVRDLDAEDALRGVLRRLDAGLEPSATASGYSLGPPADSTSVRSGFSWHTSTSHPSIAP